MYSDETEDTLAILRILCHMYNVLASKCELLRKQSWTVYIEESVLTKQILQSAAKV